MVYPSHFVAAFFDRRGTSIFQSAVALAAAVSITGSAMGGATAIATYTNASGNLKLVEIDGVVNTSGIVWFNKVVVDSGVTYTFNYNVNPNASPNASFNGMTSIKNLNGGSISTKFTIDFELCPVILTDSKFGGTANVKLLANANGGQIVCGNGPHLTGVRVNGQTEFVHYWCPFLMTSTGAGTAQTSTTFGQPLPSAAGPSDVQSFGHFADVTLTDGDTAIFTAYTVASGEVSFMPLDHCPLDVNGDGVVDKWDLVLLLQSFGDAGSCMPTDLNGDGIVDGFDLGLLIGAWGTCPE